MTVNQIQVEINQLLQENTDIITQGFFTLNSTISKNMERIKELQNMCPHCFQSGKCIYCGKKEME